MSADSGRMCNTATLMNNAPANVDPIILNLGFDLNVLDLRGSVPMAHTRIKNAIMNNILSRAVIVSYYMFLMFF